MPEYKLVHLEQLMLDDENPRLWFRDTNKSVAQSLVEDSHDMFNLADAMADGLYVPTPLLVVHDENGYVVVDGNRRLLAIQLLTQLHMFPHIVETETELKRKKIPKVCEEQFRQLRQIPILVFDTWDEIHPIRVNYQAVIGQQWNNCVRFHDYRRLVQKGYSYKDIAAFYHLAPDLIPQRINTLNLHEQMMAHFDGKPPWKPSYYRGVELHRLALALEQENIRSHLGLKSSASYNADKWPLPPKNMGKAAELMSILFGTEKKSVVMLSREESMRELDYLYANSIGLDRLLTWPNESIKDVYNRATGQQEYYRIEQLLDGVHQSAIQELKWMKDNMTDDIPFPSMVHISNTRYSLFNDHSAQYIVEITGTLDSALVDTLEKRLRNHARYDCRVVLI